MEGGHDDVDVVVPEAKDAFVWIQPRVGGQVGADGVQLVLFEGRRVLEKIVEGVQGAEGLDLTEWKRPGVKLWGQEMEED